MEHRNSTDDVLGTLFARAWTEPAIGARELRVRVWYSVGDFPGEHPARVVVGSERELHVVVDEWLALLRNPR